MAGPDEHAEPVGGVHEDDAVLDAKPWSLLRYAGADGARRDIPAATEITLTFRSGRLAGSSGCNAYTGAYRVNGDALALGTVAGTRRHCAEPPGIMEQERAYLAALGRVARIRVSVDALALLDGDGAVLLEYAPQLQTPLEGADWAAQAYNNGRGGVVSLIAGTTITARFEDGRLAGSAGCNRYRATYSLDGDAIAIGPAAATRMACPAPPGIMEQEHAYLAALATARIVRIEGRRLILQTETGARVASFVPAGAAEGDDSTGSNRDGDANVTFDLSAIDEAGLTGPPNGLVAVSYEYCIPSGQERLAEVRRIDPTTQAYPGSPGRIGCGPGETLCIGSTHQPGWRDVLRRLAALDYVARIDRHHAE